MTMNLNEKRHGYYLIAPDLLAKRLGVSRRTVGRLTAAGLIPCVRIGRLIRYDADKVVAVLAEQRNRDE